MADGLGRVTFPAARTRRPGSATPSTRCVIERALQPDGGRMRKRRAASSPADTRKPVPQARDGLLRSNDGIDDYFAFDFLVVPVLDGVVPEGSAGALSAAVAVPAAFAFTSLT